MPSRPRSAAAARGNTGARNKDTRDTRSQSGVQGVISRIGAAVAPGRARAVSRQGRAADTASTSGEHRAAGPTASGSQSRERPSAAAAGSGTTSPPPTRPPTSSGQNRSSSRDRAQRDTGSTRAQTGNGEAGGGGRARASSRSRTEPAPTATSGAAPTAGGSSNPQHAGERTATSEDPATSTATSGTTAPSGTSTSATTTAATTTTTTTNPSSPRAARPHSGAPPTYEESVNHLTLEYGGYFLPYESRPIATPLSTVPSVSYSQMNLAGRGAVGHRGSRNSVGPINVPIERRLIDERSPRAGRRSRRVGDLAITDSERVIITHPVPRELEEVDEGNDKCTKLLLPPMHICMATTCLVFNCVIPGSGTLVAAFGLFCCTKPDEWSCGKKMASSCLCLLVALAQLILTPVLLIGWIWSILWGFAYVGVSHQEYHGIKDDDDEEDELATIASGRGHRRHFSETDDEEGWSMGYHRFDHPTSAPSQRRMSFIGTGSQSDLERQRHASMLRATRSYGYVEVQGLHGGHPYGSIDHHRLARTRLQRPPGSAGSSNTLNSNRPMSQTTLTSYINDGMFINSPPPPPPPRTNSSNHPPSMVTVDM